MSGPIPEWVLNTLAAGTVFIVMFSVGMVVAAGDLRLIRQQPGLLVCGLFSVLIAVPALAICITLLLDLPRSAQVGVVLMAISPGAPVALRRSLGAGAHRAFAPGLQIAVALLAVLAMPLWIAALDEFYAGNASITPWTVAKQVFFAQLLPLALGMIVRHWRRALADRLEPRLARAGNLLLVVFLIVVLINVWETTMNEGVRVAPAIVLTTVASLAVGHWLGGPEPATRTAVAITSALRNPGLALLVAAVNAAPLAITGTVLAYALVAVLVVVPYAMWRRRVAAVAS